MISYFNLYDQCEKQIYKIRWIFFWWDWIVRLTIFLIIFWLGNRFIKERNLRCVLFPILSWAGCCFFLLVFSSSISKLVCWTRLLSLFWLRWGLRWWWRRYWTWKDRSEIFFFCSIEQWIRNMLRNWTSCCVMIFCVCCFWGGAGFGILRM